MTPKEAYDMRCIEQQCTALLKNEFTLDNLPLGARKLSKSELATKSHSAKQRPYRVFANLSWSELVQLERVVYQHASNFSHFVHLLARHDLVLARKKELDRVFRDEMNKMLQDSTITDEEPTFEESDEE